MIDESREAEIRRPSKESLKEAADIFRRAHLAHLKGQYGGRSLTIFEHEEVALTLDDLRARLAAAEAATAEIADQRDSNEALLMDCRARLAAAEQERDRIQINLSRAIDETSKELDGALAEVKALREIVDLSRDCVTAIDALGMYSLAHKTLSDALAALDAKEQR